MNNITVLNIPTNIFPSILKAIDEDNSYVMNYPKSDKNMKVGHVVRFLEVHNKFNDREYWLNNPGMRIKRYTGRELRLIVIKIEPAEGEGVKQFYNKLTLELDK